MRKIISLSVLLIITLSSGNLLAQVSENKSLPVSGIPVNAPSGGKISGIVSDAKTKAPIEYSNVVLYKAENSEMINGTISSTGGKFFLDKIPDGNYFLKVSFIGYGSKVINNIEVNSAQIDIGKIELDPESLNLDEVIVKGEKEMISYNLDKKVISVDKNITSTAELH
ncbi:MAG: hypothetical protein Fur0015_08920 [Ignavibacteriales bacterium]